MDKDYVTELLKQLEELKRKKAHKERKLQKLKGCSSKDLRKERASRSSNTSIQRDPDQLSESSLKKLDEVPKEKSSDSINNLHHENSADNLLNNNKNVSVNEKCHSLSFENHKLNKDINHSNVNINTSIAATDECKKYHDNEKTSVDSLKNCSYLNTSMKDKSHTSSKNVFLKPIVNKVKANSEKFEDYNLSYFNDKLNCSVKKSAITDKNTKTESVECLNDKEIANVKEPSSSPVKIPKIAVYSKEISNDKEIANVEEAPSSPVKIPKIAVYSKEISSDAVKNIRQNNISNDLVLVSVPDITKNCSNLNPSEDKLSNDSNKSSSSSKDKNFDILDDSLNSNMSFFMSADLFANEGNDKKDLNKDHNDNELCIKINETNLMLPHPDQSHLSVSEYQQNDVDVFNFPKFSTPTEGNTQFEKDDDMPDLIEKSPEINDSTKRNNSFTKALKHSLPSTSKCDSSLLNFVLEKRLSSVLDAHYESPKKIISKINIPCSDNANNFDTGISSGSAYKKRKLFAESNCIVSSEPGLEQKKLGSDIDSNKKSDIALCKSFETAVDDQEIKYDGFDDVSTFDSGSNSLNSLKKVSELPVTLAKNSCDDIPSQVSKTVNGLVDKICDDASNCKLRIVESVNKNEEKCIEMYEESKLDSEVLVIPETEGLGLYFAKDTQEFLETSTLSESMGDFPMKENFLNVSSQSKLESPVVNNIVAAVKSSRSFQNMHQEDKNELDVKTDDGISLERTPKKVHEKDLNDVFDNSLGLDTSFLEDDTQDLGNFKQVPYMNDENIDEEIMTDELKTDKESNLKFICSLAASSDEPVMNVEIILFNDVKYAVLQYKTCLCVWRQEKKKQWVKIFNHQIEDMLSLVKIAVSKDDDNLVIIMLLSNQEQYCLQFLIFERDARVIKLMENTHWLEERCTEDSVLLCGLSGLMFAIAECKEKPDVSIHAFISLKENPRLMTAVLGSTETPLCSLCTIDKLPNALLGISESMLYVWHILEARLVTAVSLHPQEYNPIKECFWATVENGLIYFLTTCEEDENHHICQLLAANLATGFCQSAMTYSTLPSTSNVKSIIKAAYQEPFLVVAHSEGAFLWSVMEEFCCAALPPASNITSIAISRDFENWGMLAVGSKNGQINCYSIH